MADTIAQVVDAPFGKPPFRVHIDPPEHGAEIVNGDRFRAAQIELRDILKPRMIS